MDETLGAVVIAAAGTGGHIYPGLALAEALRRSRPDVAVVFAGTPRGLESNIIPAAGYPLRLYDMVPLSSGHRARLPYALARSSAQARTILRREGASAAVSMGGYGGIPLIAGARLARVPSLIHESGAVAGRANRLAARMTHTVALAFEQAAQAFPRGTDTHVVGMPLSGELIGFDRAALRAEARHSYGIADGVTMLLVVGGSQGSVRLNEAGVGLAARWRERDDVHIVLKTGRAHLEAVVKAVADAGCGERITPVSYLERMDHAYAAADIGLMRSGAGTVAELAIAGLPAVLVPFPGAIDDHQALNAATLVEGGAAAMVRDELATADRLGPELESLLDGPELRARMAEAAASLARPHAADDLASLVLDVAAGKPSAAHHEAAR